MKSSRGTDLLPWILMGLSAVIMGVAVGVYSSDASATDSATAGAEPPSLMDSPSANSAGYGPAPEAREPVTTPTPKRPQL